MKTYTQFRESGLRALDGKWGKAVLAGLIYSAFGGIISPSLEFRFEDNQFDYSFNIGTEIFGDWALPLLIGLVTTIFLLAVATSLVISILTVGYNKFNLDLVDGDNPSIARLFFAFPDWKRIIVAELMVFVRVLVGFIFFIIPGLIAAYTYIAVPYILAEDKTLTASEALEKSESIMRGQRGRRFILGLTFIGWDILSIITLGILSIWLTPYKQATFADFYREISDTRPKPETDDFEHFDPADTAA